MTPQYIGQSTDQYTEPVHRASTPVSQLILRTDGRDGRTNEESLSPTRDHNSYVTRGRAYGFLLSRFGGTS